MEKNEMYLSKGKNGNEMEQVTLFGSNIEGKE